MHTILVGPRRHTTLTAVVPGEGGGREQDRGRDAPGRQQDIASNSPTSHPATATEQQAVHAQRKFFVQLELVFLKLIQQIPMAASRPGMKRKDSPQAAKAEMESQVMMIYQYSSARALDARPHILKGPFDIMNNFYPTSSVSHTGGLLFIIKIHVSLPF